MSSKKTTKSDEPSLEQKRLKAIEYAFWAGKLLDPKYFDKASKAIADRDKNALIKICVDAGIPTDVVKRAGEDRAEFLGDGWGVQ